MFFCYSAVMFYFYIFRCKDRTLYCGSTNNIRNREKQHNSSSLGARYTRIHGGGKMVYFEVFDALKLAMAREREVKKWSRTKKENLIKGIKLSLP